MAKKKTLQRQTTFVRPHESNFVRNRFLTWLVGPILHLPFACYNVIVFMCSFIITCHVFSYWTLKGRWSAQCEYAPIALSNTWGNNITFQRELLFYELDIVRPNKNTVAFSWFSTRKRWLKIDLGRNVVVYVREYTACVWSVYTYKPISIYFFIFLLV